MILYLFELSNKTILGFVKKSDLLDNYGGGSGAEGDMEVNYLDIEDIEVIQVYNPAVVSMVAVPVNSSLSAPGRMQEMTFAPTLLPYYANSLTVFISNVSAIAKIPEDSYLYEKLKTNCNAFSIE